MKDKSFYLGRKITELLKGYGLSFGKLLAIAVSVVFALFALFAFLQFGFVYGIYALIENWVSSRLGFDYYFSNLIATIFATAFTLLMPTLAWYIFLGKRRVWAIGTIVGIQILICFSVYTIGGNVCFDRKTGAPLCYFADTPGGRVWSRSPGFDPESGIPFQIYTRETKRIEDLNRKPKSKK